MSTSDRLSTKSSFPFAVHASLADDLKDVETTDNTMELLLHTVLHMDEQMKQMRQEVTQLKQENESYRRLEKMLVDENVEGEEKDSVVDVDEAHRRLPTLFQTVNQLKFQLNQLRNQYKATELQHNDRISALETDVATTRDAENKNLDRITAMTTDLEAIQSKATKLSDDLIQGLTSVNGRITGFENAMTAIEEAGGQATQQIQNMLSRVSAVETKTGVAESRLSGMISSNEQTIADISSRTATLEGDVTR